ncbi:50S ribosomal protein L10 [Patescibacteria group bacterium]|nr:50S ribosomal protein L10 [Patescibacteria group bacterium]MCL5010274.1 50S ribosomal protein L10 [Patescibacteria group bacterium]
MNKKISSNREKKEQIVARLLDKTNKAKSIVFLDFTGMTHKQIEELKKSLRPLKAETFTAKNTLIKIALGKSQNSTLKIDLTGPTSVLFSFEDEVAALKELAKIIKSISLPAIKLGILENKALTGEEVLKLSALPSRDVLLTRLALGMKSPIFGLHRALNWNMQKLVLTLKAIETKKA